eukprot:6213082-Pleurochrysis_carterae.AAC.2
MWEFVNLRLSQARIRHLKIVEHEASAARESARRAEASRCVKHTQHCPNRSFFRFALFLVGLHSFALSLHWTASSSRWTVRKGLPFVSSHDVNRAASLPRTAAAGIGPNLKWPSAPSQLT